MSLIVLCIGLIGWFYLQGRISSLENEVRTLHSNMPQDASRTLAPHQVSPGEKERSAAPVPMREFEVPHVVRESIVPEVTAFDRFVVWVKQDFLVKVGAFLLLSAFGWFVSYAFLNDWIGPMGRIALGLIAGTGILVLGYLRIGSYRHQGGIFAVVGSTTIILTIFAARYVYEDYGFFTPLSALVVMFLSVAFVAFLSVRYRSQNLALSSLILASLAPNFTNAPSPDVAGLFTYMFIVVLGTLWVVSLTGWSTLVATAFAIVAVYGFPFVLASGPDQDIALIFAFVFGALFFGANVLSLVRQREGKTTIAHLITAVGSALYLIFWIAAAAPQHMQSFLYIAWMFVFCVGAYLVYHALLYKIPFYLYGGASIILLGAATMTEFEGATLTIVLALEVAVLVILSRVLKMGGVTSTLAFLFVIPGLLSFFHMVAYSWESGVVHEDFFALVIFMGILLVTGALLKERGTKEAEKDLVGVGVTLMIAGVVYSLILVWLITHALLIPDSATFVSLVIYTISGLATYVVGKQTGKDILRIGGGILIGFVVGRLLLIDVWQLELAGRIITFFVVGVLLMSTAFIGRKKS